MRLLQVQTQCLVRFAHLLPLGACAHHCCTSEGLQSCEITPTAVVVWPPPCIRGNKAYGVLAGSLIVKTAESIRERLARRHVGDPFAHGEGPRLSTKLPDWELGPCEGFLTRGSNEDQGEACVLLDTSIKILESSMGVCISLLCSLASAFTLIVLFLCGRDSNTLAKPQLHIQIV